MTDTSTNGKAAAGASAAWAARAGDLADWTQHRLTNRTDAWGAYRPEEEIGREYTNSDGSKGKLGEQKTVKAQLTRAVSVRHFQARERSVIIGLHSAGADNLTKWGALDIDYHGPTSTAPEINLRGAFWWYRALVRKGFHPLLTESNGDGGYHLRVLLAETIPADRLFHMLKNLTADHKQLGFPKPPEQFPKQPDVRRCAKGFGNWLRLPGRHHKRDFWSRVWDGDRWLDGTEAIDFILTLTGDPPSFVPAVPPPPSSPPRKPRSGYGLADNLSGRIDAYLRRLPNGGAGSGRDDTAFHFAALLVRDLALSDDVALDWLCRWDEGNSTRKGKECLKEIIAHAHAYGRNAYGCGRAANDNDAVQVRLTRPGHYIMTARVEVM